MTFLEALETKRKLRTGNDNISNIGEISLKKTMRRDKSINADITKLITHSLNKKRPK